MFVFVCFFLGACVCVRVFLGACEFVFVCRFMVCVFVFVLCSIAL